jgi:flavin-dependent dehydrogenase
MTTYDFDFAVAGGGPAGSAAAITLAQRGHSVVLFERDTFPRFHIGESLLSTANEAFAKLGVAEKIEAAHFPEKWGARLLTHNGLSGRTVDFASVTEVTRPKTYQVPRAEFDRILMESAREAGVDVREATRVLDVEFTNDAAIVKLEGRDIRVRALIDATGRFGLLARKFALRNDEPRLANVAVFSHFTGVPRLPDSRPNDIRIVARNDSGWFWVIPITEELTSVGVVLPQKLLLQMPAVSNEERLERAIADTPVMKDLMRNAHREWPVRVEKDFSYSATAYAGDRWLLAGDAGSFLDPVFSTGVSVALESGIEAAGELDRALRTNDFSARNFAAFSKRQRKRYITFRDFVIGFYTPQFRDLFFNPSPPEHLFQAVVTVLAGRWNASLKTRVLNRAFFLLVALQKRFSFSRLLFRRDATAGYP